MKRLEGLKQPYHSHYYAMYSSVAGAIVTDPALMLIPVDDHMVHRGDGVFETLKCVEGAIYNLEAHLERLCGSAAKISIHPGCSKMDMTQALKETIRAGGRRECLARIFLSRGPGSLGISPYDCPAPALYIVAYESKPSFMQQHPQGARVISSRIPVKSGFFATIKSVNYLPNVLLKKEAVDAGADFSVNFDEQGFLAEGATENMGILSPDGVLKSPNPGRVLPGTTMLRTLELARAMAGSGLIKAIASADISQDDIAHASEAFIFGTTPDVTAIIEFDGRRIGNGAPGRIQMELNRILLDDICRNEQLRTRVF
ncbi:MAG: aminotransferase class IV [Lentisphaerota bacterium]